jgi:signal transduction histidine kinase
LGTPQGNQDYLAIGFGYCKEPVPGESTSIVSTFNPEYFRPDMVTDLGIVLTPVYQRPQAGQIDWEPPYKTIPIPAAALPFYLEPNGRPCLFAYTGGTGGNGWHTVVSQREIFDSKHPDLVTNDDSWGTYYLINLELDDPINDRIRVGEAMEITNQVDHQDFINIWGISAHTTSVSATECAIMIEPTHADKGFLYTYYSEEKHGTETAPWRFFPESSTVGSPIPYDRTPEHRTAFEDSSQRLGFAYINGPSDEFPTTSIGLLRQPEFYNLQELIGFYELHDNPENPLDVFFLGIVPRKDNGQDIYIFATSDSRMIVLDENCRLIETYPIARQFLWDRSFYQVVPQTGSMYPLRASFPQIVTLTTPRSTRIFEMVMNEAWIPYWSKWKLSAWLALVLLYGILVPFTMQYYRRKGIFSYGELTRSVEEKEMEIGRVHLQHSAKMGSRLGQIADSLAHDLNTPLDAVRKNLELMQDSNPYNIVNEVSTIFHDDQLVRRFLQILSRHTITPIFLSIAEVNSRTDMLEEFLDENYPRHSDYADSFANNGFDQDAVKAFIEEFGPEASIKLILILDREVSARRAIKYSLDQTVLSLGIANRLKNLTSRKAFDIRLGIESALQMVQGDLVARKIKVSQNFENLPSLRGDPVPLIETITIIMQNAIDVLPEGGEIRLNVKRRDNWLLISIGNNGPLIPQESLPKIWQRGFSEGKPGGQGLGLYIAKDLTEQQGGKISVKSEPEWTEFEIRMPLSPTSE